ncbi:DNA-binding protein [Rhizobium bangladeshense]|uniref:DNA-binding protein n=1 Tax=Rhizobium TaxID=379 RepID=UPI001C833014|nr:MULTISPECIES: DNA-binding protein [Rhizobium]MBX4873259.1 DNA-binding protein [Rhizobium bangladeshense]MBX4884636.1 DNA-binding protein [Rhizobium bangladeshense]MBX5146349.1 DNA-binding protein [Rhizobium lentis]
MPDKENSMDLIWGGEEIAKVIGRTPRITFSLLEKGELPAKKVGGRWVAERSKLIAFFMEAA